MNHLKSDHQKVRISNASGFQMVGFQIQTELKKKEWSDFQMDGTIAIAQPFETWTIRNPIFKKSGLQMFPDFEWSDFRSPLYLNVQYSDHH